MIRRLLLALVLGAALLPAADASAQEATRQDDQPALQKNFAWAVEATRDYVARAEGWPESEYTITLKVDSPDQPRSVTARVVRRDNQFFGLEECFISPPICWNELRFSVETKEIYYMLWGTQ
ncbi:hypothetical protein [Pelagibius marinus]|uniref:hypothetical protein n=1 Tax=Pelagibius marinus TaxID=2762760 RepID=UPI001872579D|nr:hypothetical protein [Pelagibius marinus]